MPLGGVGGGYSSHGTGISSRYSCMIVTFTAELASRL